MNVETGRGFLPATVAEGLPIGVIPVDAIFTPVKRVNYNVSHTRVGQATNFDRLDIEVWTDGSISGQDAVSLAAEILREQQLPFHRLGRPDVADTAAPTDVERPFEGYDTPIEALGLSVRAFNCLKRSGLITVGAVLEQSEEELLALRNFGEKSYVELRDKLSVGGFPAPRTEVRRPAVSTIEPDGDGVGVASDPPPGTDDVGSLGQALMEALREASGGDVPERG